jgi:[ribosomal protein S5]-alanine N-acetyltransferase
VPSSLETGATAVALVLPRQFQTERLNLRMPRPEDAVALFEEYVRDPEVTRYMVWRPHRGLEETRNYLATCLARWETGEEFTWALVIQGQDRPIGMLGCRLRGHMMDIGFVLARRYWGQGYMAEAVKTLVDWAIAQEGIYRVWAVCDLENRRSSRVLEKAGLQLEGILRRWGILPNLSDEPRDCFSYARVKQPVGAGEGPQLHQAN